jgi:hypothetical protein
MLQEYTVSNGRIVQGSEGSIPIDMYLAPDESEKARLIGELA